MLNIQTFLRSGGNPEDLNLKVSKHSTLPLSIYNYSQIDNANKYNAVTMECRALTLENETFNLVGKSFNRFFNLGEYEVGENLFDWADYVAYEKLDGSLMTLFYYAGEWVLTTRGTVGTAETQTGRLYTDLFYEVLDRDTIERANLCRQSTFLFEYCGPHNKNVTPYDTSLYLIGAVDNITLEEWHDGELDDIATKLKVQRPSRVKLKSKQDAIDLIEKLEKDNPILEGVVLCDKSRNRIKLKSRTWIDIFYLKNNGNVASKYSFCEIFKRNEVAEVVSRLPEYRQLFGEYTTKLEDVISEASKVYDFYKDLDSQKSFALKVKDLPFASWLFLARSKKISVREAALLSKNLENFL